MMHHKRKGRDKRGIAKGTDLSRPISRRSASVPTQGAYRDLK